MPVDVYISKEHKEYLFAQFMEVNASSWDNRTAKQKLEEWVKTPPLLGLQVCHICKLSMLFKFIN